MSKYYISVAFLVIIFFLQINLTLAHPGNTDSSGGHTCRTNCPRWGLEYGEYHFHGGRTYSSPTYYYQKPKTQIPEYLIKDVQAVISPKLIDNGLGCGYEVSAKIDNPNGFSYKTSFTRSNRDDATQQIGQNAVYEDITPGKWYLNLKITSLDYDLPSLVYWETNIPEIIPYAEVKLGTDKMVSYNLRCIKSVASKNETLQENIKISRNNDDGSSTGAFEAWDTYGRQEVVVTDYYGKKYTSVLEFPEKNNLSSSLESVKEDDNLIYLVISSVLIFSFIIILFQRFNDK